MTTLPPPVTALLIVSITLFSIGLVPNLVILYTIIGNRQLHSPVNHLIASLAILSCVLLTSCLSVFTYYLSDWDSAGLNQRACNVQGLTCMLSAGCYLSVLTLLSYNRYDVVCNRAVWTPNKTATLLVLVVLAHWTQPFFFGMGWNSMVQQPNRIYCLWDWADNQGVALIPTVTVLLYASVMSATCCMCYLRTYRTVRVHMVAMKAAIRQWTDDLRMSKNFAIILVTHLVFWLPYLQVILYCAITGKRANPIIDACCLTLLGLNAVFTPAIFAGINEALRRAVYRTVMCRGGSRSVMPSFEHSVTDDVFMTADMGASHLAVTMKLSPRHLSFSPSAVTRIPMHQRTPSFRIMGRMSSSQFDRPIGLKLYASSTPTQTSEDPYQRQWLGAGPPLPIIQQNQLARSQLRETIATTLTVDTSVTG